MGAPRPPVRNRTLRSCDRRLSQDAPIHADLVALPAASRMAPHTFIGHGGRFAGLEVKTAAGRISSDHAEFKRRGELYVADSDALGHQKAKPRQGMENPAEVRRSSSASGGLNSEPPPLRETLVRLCCETDIPNKSSPDGDADWLTAPAAENTPGGLLAHRTLTPRFRYVVTGRESTMAEKHAGKFVAATVFRRVRLRADGCRRRF